VLETLDEELMEALHSDARDFFVTILRHRIGLLGRVQEMILAVLPEVLVSPELRERFYRQFVLRAATLLEHYVQARIEMGHIRPVNAPLATRVVQATFIGLLLFRVFGDEVVLSRWDDVPEVLATILFDGLSPREGA
jgi:hypothetical protein